MGREFGRRAGGGGRSASSAGGGSAGMRRRKGRRVARRPRSGPRMPGPSGGLGGASASTVRGDGGARRRRPMAMRRGFSASGTWRRRLTCSRPFSELGAVHTMWSASTKRRSKARPAMPGRGTRPFSAGCGALPATSQRVVVHRPVPGFSGAKAGDGHGQDIGVLGRLLDVVGGVGGAVRRGAGRFRPGGPCGRSRWRRGTGARRRRRSSMELLR